MASKIMVIDDEVDIQSYLRAAFEDNGYDTCSLEEKESIPDAIRKHKPDLIILDIMMPRRSGVSIYLELRTSTAFRDIPIVMISGISPVKDFMSEGLDKLIDDKAISPPDGFIEKPIKLAPLMETAEKLLHK
jgi:two-component system phosphate regulon response regulator PhoB